MADFNGLTAYLSIDLDDLTEDCQADETKPVRDRSKEAGREQILDLRNSQVLSRLGLPYIRIGIWIDL